MTSSSCVISVSKNNTNVFLFFLKYIQPVKNYPNDGVVRDMCCFRGSHHENYRNNVSRMRIKKMIFYLLFHWNDEEIVSVKVKLLLCNRIRSSILLQRLQCKHPLQCLLQVASLSKWWDDSNPFLSLICNQPPYNLPQKCQHMYALNTYRLILYRQTSKKIWMYIQCQENAFENVACKMSSALFVGVNMLGCNKPPLLIHMDGNANGEWV